MALSSAEKTFLSISADSIVRWRACRYPPCASARLGYSKRQILAGPSQITEEVFGLGRSLFPGRLTVTFCAVLLDRVTMVRPVHPTCRLPLSRVQFQEGHHKDTSANCRLYDHL